jgi:pilus assembly protein CpaB
MRNKSLFLLLACVCGTVAAIGVSQWMQANNQSGPAFETVEIFVTAQEVDVQEEITADKIKLEQWPADKIPAGATNDLSELEGRYAKQPFYAGEPVLSVKLMNDKDDVIVPKGYSVVSMPADRGGIANLVKQGDRVDVRAYFTQNELIPRTTSKTILSGVRVFAIDGRTKRDDDDARSKAVRTISLLIRKADEEAWTYAEKLGEISLSLGSPGDYENSKDVTEASQAGQEFLKWLADLREEQERARLASIDQDEPDAAEPTTLAPAPKKKTWQMLKYHRGKMTLFEFEEGNPMPRIIEVSGESTDQEEQDPEPTSGADSKSDLDHLLGEDSPFFQPRGGKDGSDAARSYKRTPNR